MKRLSGITFVLAASLLAAQAQAESCLWTTLKTLPQQPWAQKVSHLGQVLVTQGEAWICNNPKKSIILGALAGSYCLWKIGSYLKLQCTGSKVEKYFGGYKPIYSTFPQKGKKKTALIFSAGFGWSKDDADKIMNEFNKLTQKNKTNQIFPITFQYQDADFFDPKFKLPESPQNNQLEKNVDNKKKVETPALDLPFLVKTITWDNFLTGLKALKAITRINLGGIPDTEILLYAIIRCAEAGTPIIIFGHSRGGAAAIRALHMLAYPEQYLSTWQKFGYTKRTSFFKLIPDKKRIDAIAQKIEKVFLANPLLDMKSVFKNISQQVGIKHAPDMENQDRTEKVTQGEVWLNDAYLEQQQEKKGLFQRITDWFHDASQAFEQESKQCVSETAMEIFTDLQSPHWEKQPIELLEALFKKKDGKQFDINFNFAERDTMVRNDHDQTVINLAQQSCGKWMIGENNNSHFDTNTTWQQIAKYVTPDGTGNQIHDDIS